MWLIRFVVEFYRETLRRFSGGGSTAGIPQVERFARRFGADTTADAELFVSLIERALESEEQIQRMTPVPLCLEALFDNLGRQQRREQVLTA